jgi:DNA replication and repair protein RecF
MYLQKLTVSNFKNYSEANLVFSEKINCFVGNNGAGKTNLLDAIHYLSFCKSYFNLLDNQNIRHDAAFFVIMGTFSRADAEDDVYCGLRRNQKKIFKINKKEYNRLADHIGLFPLVIISPADYNLINEGSEIRRKYFDSVISQFDKIYLDNLINYNKAIVQRNSLLKDFGEKHFFDMTLLEIWDEQIIPLGKAIFEKRKVFLDEFIPIFKQHYSFITNGKEEVDIEYESQLNEGNFEDILQQAVDRDRVLRFSTVGVHKDDFSFNIAAYPVKKFGSQGQQKSFIIALKLSQFDFTKNIKGYKPILLFDDIFDKLDNDRVNKIMQLVSNNSFGQVFITDAHPERIDAIFATIDTDGKIFEVVNGMLNDEKPIN